MLGREGGRGAECSAAKAAEVVDDLRGGPDADRVTGVVKAAEHWEAEAKRWVAWARTPGHDAYWYYRDAFFALVPPPGRATLEVGCGEGRVTRDLARRGHRVIGIDIAPTLLGLARASDGASAYLVADGAALPFGAAGFDVVVAYNSLMDVDDMPGVVREIARVLRPGGRLCVCVTHPVWDAGRFATREAEAPFVIDGPYLGRRRYEGTFARGGLSITFRGWAYALEDYARALEAAGLAVEVLREPTAASHAPPGWRRNGRIPVFLMLRALKLGEPRGGRVSPPGTCRP